jgi:hypothetical protein
MPHSSNILLHALCTGRHFFVCHCLEEPAVRQRLKRRRNSDASSEDAGDAGAPTSSSGDDAGNDARCRDLANQAGAQFTPVQARYQTCAADSDCVEITVDGCLGVCPQVRTNTAGAAALPAAATMACQEFHGAGCQALGAACPAEDSADICISGSCAGWNPTLQWQATSFVHGVCVPFEIDFTMEGAKTPAPHDMAFTMTPTNGAFYADAACTTPLTGEIITIPAGAGSVAFGFEALDPGTFFLSGTTSPGNDQAPRIGMGNIAQSGVGPRIRPPPFGNG